MPALANGKSKAKVTKRPRIKSSCIVRKFLRKIPDRLKDEADRKSKERKRPCVMHIQTEMLLGSIVIYLGTPASVLRSSFRSAAFAS